jgi:peroxiredoxin
MDVQRSSYVGTSGAAPTRRRWFEELILLSGIVRPVFASSGQSPAGSTAGKQSPPLTVHTADRRIIEIHEQTGKVVLVDFMTTTCPNCKRASAGIQRLYREFGEKGFFPVAVAIDPQAINVLPIYKNLYGLTFPVGAAPREEVIRYLGHPANKPLLVPTLVLLDKRGRVSRTQVGWKDEQDLRSVIAELLNQKM